MVTGWVSFSRGLPPKKRRQARSVSLAASMVATCTSSWLAIEWKRSLLGRVSKKWPLGEISAATMFCGETSARPLLQSPSSVSTTVVSSAGFQRRMRRCICMALRKQRATYGVR